MHLCQLGKQTVLCPTLGRIQLLLSSFMVVLRQMNLNDDSHPFISKRPSCDTIRLKIILMLREQL